MIADRDFQVFAVDIRFDIIKEDQSLTVTIYRNNIVATYRNLILFYTGKKQRSVTCPLHIRQRV